MLAGENGDKVLAHIYSLGFEEIVYHRETIAEVFLALIADIKVKLVAVCPSAFKDNGAGNNISGSKLKALIVILHKALLVAVKKICTLASYRLGNKEAFS